MWERERAWDRVSERERESDRERESEIECQREREREWDRVSERERESDREREWLWEKKKNYFLQHKKYNNERIEKADMIVSEWSDDSKLDK